MIVDTHCHLDLNQFDEDRSLVMTRAHDANVRIIINPGIDLEHSRQAIRLAEQYSEYTDTLPEVYAAVGIHPNSSGDFDETTIAELRRLAAHPRVVAIGEIGLDYYWDKVLPEQQAIAFRAQLALADELGLPVIIHSRESNEDVAVILREWVESPRFQSSLLQQRPYAGVLHAYSGDLALAQEAYSWKFVLSLGGPVTFKNAKQLHALVPQLRLDRLMLETDAPFLTPHPYRGKRNEPAYTALTCDRIAELMAVTRAEVAQTTTQLACQFFGIDGD
ncbi:MAG: TatD family hydrolase [Chloroflexota bacterium]